MKKIFLLTLISLISFTTIFAQKGNFTLATKVTGLDLVFGENDKMNFNFGLVGAYFITEKTVVDAGLAYKYEEEERWIDSSYNSSSAVQFWSRSKILFLENLLRRNCLSRRKIFP